MAQVRYLESPSNRLTTVGATGVSLVAPVAPQFNQGDLMLPQYVSIKNLEKYQHYTHRNPPWVKLHYSLLDDPAFLALDEVQQCRYIKLIMLASRQMNCISTDPEYLGRVMRVSEQVDVTPLIDAGFLIASRKRQSSKMLSPPHENRSQSRVEKSRVEKIREEKEPPISPLPSFQPPEWLPREQWEAYLDMRKSIKSPLTPHGLRLAMKELLRLRDAGHDPEAVLNQSIFNNWKGLFALKEGNDGAHQQKFRGRTAKPGSQPPQPGKYAHLGTVFDPGGED